MRVLLVAPRYKPYGQYYELPIGLAYISSYLKSKGIDTHLLNLNEHPNDSPLYPEIEKSDYFCTGGLSVHYEWIKQLFLKSRYIKPSIINVVGGGLYSAQPNHEMLSWLNADQGISGEGEHALYTKLTGEVIEHPTIDDLPFPDYEGLGVREYLDRQLCGDEYYMFPYDKPRALPIISSRSCPFNCSFCFHPLGRRYRQRSLENIFREIDMLVETYNINILVVLDELFAADPERLNEFCLRIKKYKLKWICQLRVDSVTKEVLTLLKDAGCFQISYGIESADDTVLKSMNKHITLEQINNALQWTYEAGIGIQGNLIFGDRAETPFTAKRSLDWWEEHLQYLINLTYLIAYPGTDLYKYALENGIIKDPKVFLEQGCPTVFLSKDFPTVSKMVEARRGLNLINSSSCIFIDQKVADERGRIYSAIAECPHCHRQNEYKNLYWGSTGIAFTQEKSYRIGCRHCNQRFDLPKF
jgi:anaerobic magnesium-protoporphyrin IX monomethyl ester cyclase